MIQQQQQDGKTIGCHHPIDNLIIVGRWFRWYDN
jgi:hypothetical protein